MELKHIKKPDGLTDDQGKFLKTLDDAFESILQKTKTGKEEFDKKFATVQEQLKQMSESQNYEIMQKQLNEIFKQIESKGKRLNGNDSKAEQKALTKKWIRAFIDRDKDQIKSVESELKGFEPFMQTGTDETQSNYLEQGSYLIPELLANEINRFVEEYGVARREMRYLPFSGAGNERRIPRLSQTVVVSWVDEAGRKPKTTPYVGQVVQSLKKLAAIAPFTDEILKDSAIDLISLTGTLFGEEIAKEEDRVFLTGSTLASDPFDGVLNASDVKVQSLAATKLVSDLDADILNNAIYKIKTSARPGAKWFLNPEVLGVLQRLKDEQGQYIVQQPTGDLPLRMWNYPIVLSDVLPGLTNSGSEWDAETPFMFFSNLSRTCVYGDKGGMQMKMLDQATLTDSEDNTINLAENDMTAMRVVKRVGYVPVLPEGICVIKTGSAT